jgi:hypothetical protein
MLDRNFYISLWRGDSSEFGRPPYLELFGWDEVLSDQAKLYKKIGTIDGILTQYRDLNFPVGIIYHLDPIKMSIDKRCYEKSKTERIADGHLKDKL